MKLTVVNLPDEAGGNITKDLFNGAWCRGARIGNTCMPPLSLLYAYTAVAPHTSRKELIDAVYEKLSVGALARRVRPDTDLIIAHTGGYVLHGDTAALLTLRRAIPNATVAVFGNLAPSQANGLIAKGAAHFVCPQDPEEILAEMATKLEGTGRLSAPVLGLLGADSDRATERELLPLDDKPVPDRTPILSNRYTNLLATTDRWTTALASRGCPYRCTFCNTPGYYDCGYRCHSIDYVLHELRTLLSLGYREVFFRDDLFYAGRVAEFCEVLLSSDIDLAWSCNQRVDTLDEPTVALMARAGCHTIKFGVESGDDAILAGIQKPSFRRTEEQFAACARQGVRTHAHLMIGLPGESREQMERTIALVSRLDPYTFTLNLFTPHYGSALYEELSRTGVTVGGQFKERVKNNPSLVSDEELHALLRRAYLRYYMSPRRILRYARNNRQWGKLAKAGWRLLRDFTKVGR